MRNPQYALYDDCEKWANKLRACVFILEARQDSHLAKVFSQLAETLSHWGAWCDNPDQLREYLKVAKYFISEFLKTIEPKAKKDDEWV
jgi:hypothetical protein